MIMIWCIQLFLAYSFAKAGVRKIQHDVVFTEKFNRIGPVLDFTPDRFREYIGTLEFLSSIFFLISPLASLAGTLMMCVMLGAMLMHVMVLKDGAWKVPGMLFLLCLVVTVVLW